MPTRKWEQPRNNCIACNSLNQTWNSTRAGRSRVVHTPLRFESCLRGAIAKIHSQRIHQISAQSETRSLPRHRTDDALHPEGNEKTEVLHPHTHVCMSTNLSSQAKTEVEVLNSGKVIGRLTSGECQRDRESRRRRHLSKS